MKREYFGMLFIIVFVLLVFLAEYLIGEEVWNYLSQYIVIWILVAFYAGQYSMKFPKAF
jgi:energy-coupling factor transporter transmembrane protein EcfT